MSLLDLDHLPAVTHPLYVYARVSGPGYPRSSSSWTGVFPDNLHAARLLHPLEVAPVTQPTFET